MRRSFAGIAVVAACGSPYTDLFDPDEAPTGVIVSPAPNALVPSGRVELVGRAADGEDPPSRLFATWSLGRSDGAYRDVCGALADEDGATRCIVTVDPGVTQVRLLVQDVRGYRGEDVVPVVVRDVSAPVVTVEAPEPTTRIHEGLAAAFRVRVADDDGDARAVALRWEASPGGRLDGPASPDASGRAETTVLLSAGEYELQVVATDADGLVGTGRVRVGVRPPNAAPRVRIESPADGVAVAVGEVPQLEATVLDDEDRPDTLQVRLVSDLDGALPVSGPDAFGLVQSDLSDLRVGVHTLTLRAEDPVGGVGEGSVVVVVDTPPVVIVTAPVPGGTYPYRDGIPIAATATDARPGAALLTWRVDADFAIGVEGATTPAPGAYTATLRAARAAQDVVVTVTDGYGLATSEVRRVTVVE